jgi:EmrB/QacA subfamily drug resistance transporter
VRLGVASAVIGSVDAETRRRIVFAACILSVVMAAVEGTVVATAMPTIVADLGGLRLFSWVFAIYFLTQAVTIPIYGRLSDIYGRKKLFFIGCGLFLTGSVLCGFAHAMVPLIAFRALQGLGAGGLQPVATTIVGDLYSPAERARVQGYLSSAWGFSAIGGPLLGAVLVHWAWPLVFWVNVPIGLTCIAALAFFLHENVKPREHRIDYAGSVLLALGAGTLMFALVLAGSLSGGVVAALFAAAVLVLVMLLVYESRVPEPMLPLKLWNKRVIALGNVGCFCLGWLLMGVSAFMPTYVQAVMGDPAIVAGVILGSMSICWTLGSVIGGRVMIRTSYRMSAAAGGVMLLLGGTMLVVLDPARGPVWAGIGSSLLGLGLGMSNSSFLVSTQSAVEWGERGVATASNLFMRQFGQTIGTAAFGAVFNAGVYRNIPDASGAVTRLMNAPLRRALDPTDLTRFVDAIARPLHDIYAIVTGLGLIVLLVALALPARLAAHATRSPEQSAESGA